MPMSRSSSLMACAAGAALLVPAAAQAWTRSYLVEWIEPAFYYGGPENGVSTSIGTDCPKGINPEMDWDKQLLTGYRDKTKVAEIHNAEYPRRMFLAHLGFRGPRRDNVYENPTTIPDPGLIEVEGKIAEGFDLDGNPNTGFTSPSGQQGVDNAFYKVSGCINFYRGKPRDGFIFKYSNEAMQNGAVTMVMVMSGDKDPTNDDDVTIGLYTSQDQMVKDAGGLIANDYSFKIDPKSTSESIFKAKIKDGVLESVDRPLITLFYNFRFATPREPVELFQSMARFEFKPDGSAQGQIGGYREFIKHYREVSSRDDTENYGTAESLGRYNVPAWYYALRREADGLPDPLTNKNLGISTAYRLYLKPAFVIAPDSTKQVTAPISFRRKLASLK